MEHTEGRYIYGQLADRIIGKISNFRERGKGTAGTKKAVDDILVEAFGKHQANPSFDASIEALKAAQTMLLQTYWEGDSRMDIVGRAIAQAEGG